MIGIAQAYGVPSMLVGVPGDDTFANYREARFHLWKDRVFPFLNIIIHEINGWMTVAQRESLRFASIPATALRQEAQWARL